ncbi:MAG TPA: alkaline phosphatase family protein [Nitrososphaerales archaeon]|nr:alkaline phosphatase family protein [Nitrososphaerales archaeon]
MKAEVDSKTSAPSDFRVLVIGIDACDPTVVSRLVKEGKLPNFAKMMQKGVTGDLFAKIPVTAPSWSTIYTGKNSGKHGIYSPLYQRPGTYDVGIIHSGLRMSQDLWEVAAAKGVACYVVNTPATYPPRPFNGKLVVGHYAPEGTSNYCYPPEIAEEVMNVLGKFQVYPAQRYSEAAKLLEFRDALARTMALTEHMMDKNDWRLTFVVFREVDEAQHIFIEKPETLSLVYGWMDTFIGRLLDKVDDKTFVMVVSDHGACPIRQRIDVVSPLIRSGMLKLTPVGKQSRRVKMIRAGLVALARLRITKLFDFPPLRKLSTMVRRRVMGLHVSTARSISTLVDWDHTLAYPYLTMGYRVNLKGREPKGVVDPADYDKVVARLVGILKEMKDAETGKPIHKFILPGKEAFNGPCLDDSPDVYGLPLDGYWPYVWQSTVETLMTPTLTWKGAHASSGVFILNGPGVRQGIRLPEVTNEDVAPMALYLLGVPIPEDMDGKVRKEGLSPSLIEELPILRSAGSGLKGVGTGITKEEENLIEENLRKLGYLD